MDYKDIFQPSTIERLNKQSAENLKKMLGDKSLMQTLVSSQQLLGEIMEIEKPYISQLEELAVQMIEDMYPIIHEDNIQLDAKIVGMSDVNASLDEIKVNKPGLTVGKEYLVDQFGKGNWEKVVFDGRREDTRRDGSIWDHAVFSNMETYERWGIDWKDIKKLVKPYKNQLPEIKVSQPKRFKRDVIYDITLKDGVRDYDGVDWNKKHEELSNLEYFKDKGDFHMFISVDSGNIVNIKKSEIKSGRIRTNSLNENTPESKRRVINGITQGSALKGTFSFYMFKEYLDAIDPTLVEKYNQLMKEVFGIYDDPNAVAMFLQQIAMGQKMGGGSSKVIINEIKVNKPATIFDINNFDKDDLIKLKVGNYIKNRDGNKEKIKLKLNNVIRTEEGNLYDLTKIYNKRVLRNIGESVEPKQKGITIKARAICFPMLVHECIKGLYELVSLQGFSGTKDQKQAVADKVDKLEHEPMDIRYGQQIFNALNDIFADSEYDDNRMREYFFAEVYQLGDAEFVEFVENALTKTLTMSDKSWIKSTLKDIAYDLRDDDYDATGLDEIKVNKPKRGEIQIINSQPVLILPNGRKIFGWVYDLTRDSSKKLKGNHIFWFEGTYDFDTKELDDELFKNIKDLKQYQFPYAVRKARMDNTARIDVDVSKIYNLHEIKVNKPPRTWNLLNYDKNFKPEKIRVGDTILFKNKHGDNKKITINRINNDDFEEFLFFNDSPYYYNSQDFRDMNNNI